MRNVRPVIGLTCDFLEVRGGTKFTARERYVDALTRAGALPILLPPTLADVPAQLALEYEMSLALAAMDSDSPMLGVCLGAQLINVASGGSLRDDLPLADVAHRDEAQGLSLRHDVDVMKDSLLARALGLPRGGRISVNSSHHNAPDGLGEKLRACALAPDGVIEAVEHRDLTFCLGVQWHPEADAASNPASLGLFASLALACSARRAAHR
jgi:putative glutamine amidotransferase